MLDHQFLSWDLEDFVAILPLPGNAYLYQGNSFQIFVREGQPFPTDKLEFLLGQNIKMLFIKRSDEDKFKAWLIHGLETEKQSLILAVGEENQKLVENHLSIKRDILSFVTGNVTEEKLKSVLNKTKKFIEFVQEKKCGKYLDRLLNLHNTLADHSMNVANIATYLALCAGINASADLEIIYLGAILHDFGKTKIFKDPNLKIGSNAYVDAMRKHPAIGRSYLFFDGSLPKSILDIVEQHHEHHDGSGTPNGLKGDHITLFAQIVGFSNAFENLMILQIGSKSERQRKALDVLAQDRGTLFESRLKNTLVKALELVI